MKLQLKELRKREGYKTQEDLAKALGCSMRSVANWEQGISEMSIERACQIATLLNCSVDELAGLKPIGEPIDYEGALKDPRARGIIRDYEMLDESSKDAAAGAVRGIAYTSRGE